MRIAGIKTAFLVCSAALLLYLPSCQNDTKEISKVTQKDSIFPTESGKQIDLLYTDSGQVRVKLTSPLMNHYAYKVKERYTEMPNGLYIEFFNDSGKVKSTLRANYAIRYEDTKKTEIKYKVVVVNASGEVLNTEKLYWDENKRRIYTDAFVKITTKREVLQGNGMDADEDFSEWEIKNPTGSVSIKNEDKK